MAVRLFADAIHLAMGGPRLLPLSRTENLVHRDCVFQPITRSELSQLLGKELSQSIAILPTGDVAEWLKAAVC